jgi:hypothetical protein
MRREPSPDELSRGTSTHPIGVMAGHAGSRDGGQRCQRAVSVSICCRSRECCRRLMPLHAQCMHRSRHVSARTRLERQQAVAAHGGDAQFPLRHDPGVAHVPLCKSIDDVLQGAHVSQHLLAQGRLRRIRHRDQLASVVDAVSSFHHLRSVHRRSRHCRPARCGPTSARTRSLAAQSAPPASHRFTPFRIDSLALPRRGSQDSTVSCYEARTPARAALEEVMLAAESTAFRVPHVALRNVTTSLPASTTVALPVVFLVVEAASLRESISLLVLAAGWLPQTWWSSSPSRRPRRR